MHRPIVDLGPDFEQRWKRTPLATRRAFVAELRDLYVMLEHRDEHLIARLKKGSIPPPRDSDDDLPLLGAAPAGLRQGNLFADTGSDEGAPPLAMGSIAPAEAGTDPASPSARGSVPAPAPGNVRENPFLPRSVLDRLQQNRDRASSVLRDAPAADGSAATGPGQGRPLPASHEQSDLERELRLKLGPLVETLIDAQMEMIKSELRVRLRLEMDRLIAEHLRK